MTYPKTNLNQDVFPLSISLPQEKIAPAQHLFSQIHLRHKLKLAQTLLENYNNIPLIVFCSRKRDKFLLHKYLIKAGINAGLAAETPQQTSPQMNILITSDTCQYQQCKGQVKGIVHFDIPPRLSDYANRLTLFGVSDENISHAIVTLREVAMLNSYHNELSVISQARTVPGFEENNFSSPF